MSDFVAVLNFYKDCFLQLFGLNIPLGSDLAIKWGAIVLGLVAFPLFVKVIFHLFSDSSTLAAQEAKCSNIDRKGGKR